MPNEKRSNNDVKGYQKNGQNIPFISEEDNRIDWERKQKRKQQDAVVDLMDEPDGDFAGENGRKSRKENRKNRHLVYDEGSGRVIVKRKHKRQQVNDLHFWDDEF